MSYLKRALRTLLFPNEDLALKELETLRAQRVVGMVHPNVYYRQNVGAAVLFTYVCPCGTEHRLPSPLGTYHCGACKADFNLYRAAGIIDGKGKFIVHASQVDALLQKIPGHPNPPAPPSRPPFVDTWNDVGEVEYNGNGNTRFGI